MRRVSVGFAAAAVTAVALVGAPGAAAQEVSDASCPGPEQALLASTVPETFRVAQTFTALNTGKLSRAQADVQKSAGSSGDYVLAIYPVDASGFPVDSPLASATIPNDAVPAETSTIEAVFLQPADVVAGGQYALVVSRPGGSQFALPVRTSGDDCPGLAYFSDAGPFTPSNNVDLLFAVFVTLDEPLSPQQAETGTCRGEAATLTGTDADDVISGTPGRDVIAGLRGRDEIRGLDGDDLICGHRGQDVIHGQGGDDELFGARGQDRILGGADNDLLVGGANADDLFGGQGKDLLRGGSPDAPPRGSKDLCRGGPANDKLQNCERK